MFGHSAWLLLCLLAAPATCSRLADVQTSGDYTLQADTDGFEIADDNGEDPFEELEEVELDDMSPNQKAILSIQSTLGKIADATVEAGTAAAPVVLHNVGRFGKFAFTETVHLTSGLLEAVSMCHERNRELVLSAVSQMQSFARMTAAIVVEHWPKVRSGLKSFAAATSTEIVKLSSELGPIVETKILTPLMENISEQFEKLRDSAFEQHPDAEKVSESLMEFSTKVATLSAVVANHSKELAEREDVQQYLKYIQDSAGQLAGVALEKSKPGLAAFAEFAKNKIQDLSGQALKAMCDPQVRKRVRDAIAMVLRNARKLAIALKDQSPAVKHFIGELAKGAHTKIVILVSQVVKQAPSPIRDELVKTLEDLKLRTLKMVGSSPQEAQRQARSILGRFRNLLHHIPRVPGFGKNIPFAEAAAGEDCRWTNFLLRPVNMQGQRRSMEETIDACQERCASVEGCEFYSYWPDGGCHLQSGEARDRLRHAQHVIAGPRICEK